jgi:transposase
MEGDMTLENPEKPKPETAKGIELKEKIRVAVALKFFRNLTDAQIAEHFNVSPYSVADWKRRPEWGQEIKAIANEQLTETSNELLAMSAYARQVLQQLMESDSPTIRLKVAQFLCQLPIKLLYGK